MAISINTSEYIQYKKAIIDGVELGFRILSSAETLEIIGLESQVQNDPKNQTEALKRLLDIVFATCDKPDKAREILSDLSFDAVMDIYDRIIKSEEND